MVFDSCRLNLYLSSPGRSSAAGAFRPAIGTEAVKLQTVILDVERGSLLGTVGQSIERGRVEVFDAAAAGADDMVVMVAPFLVAALRFLEMELLYDSRVS
jgi:hypothetical protein